MKFCLYLTFCLSLAWTLTATNYLNYDELTARLVQIAKEHPDRAFLYSIGKSAQNRDLWVMAIAKSQPQSHVLLRPEVNFVGNVYGSELTTRDVLLQFIQLLLTNPENDTRVDEILEKTRVHVLVSANPDGAAEQIANSVRLNNLRRKKRNYLGRNNYFPAARSSCSGRTTSIGDASRTRMVKFERFYLIW